MAKDLFGLKREQLILKSGVRELFKPHEPIDQRELFFGRQGEVQRIVECMTTPGLHALLFGARGVGKSSLANVAVEVLLSELIGGNLVTVRCDSQSTFESVARKILTELGIDTTGAVATDSRTEGGDASVKIPGLAGGGINTSRTVASSRTTAGTVMTPTGVVDALGSREALVVIDEFDAIRESSDRRALAEVMKLLSDARAHVKLLVVGIASSATDLVAGHASVQRNVREVELPQMSDAEIRAIIDGNANRAKLRFDSRVTGEIVELSAGYPHFAQLLGLACAESAVGDGRRDIGSTDMQASLASATQNAEGTLRRTYRDASRSATTNMFGLVLRAAADIERSEFSAVQWRESLGRLTGSPVTQNELNNYLQRLVAEDESKIITRLMKGVYRFTDPRMKSYVRIAARQSHG